VKIAMVEALADAGLRTIEVTSFVRPDVVPNLADAEAVLTGIRRREGVIYRALAPNRRGAERALAAGADELLALITASETYSRKNQNMSLEESLVATEELAAVAAVAGVPVVAAIGLAIYCPYEGRMPVERILAIVDRVRACGIESAYVATSAGLDGPRDVFELCSAVLAHAPGVRLGVHLHDTNGMALANALAAAQAGATFFEGAACGIGGGIRMPDGYPPCGNVPTEDLLNLFHELGVDTGVDVDAAVGAARTVRDLLELDSSPSHALAGATRSAHAPGANA
jgi:hydroxymethylglutaryl-CoA lyase